MFDGKRHLNINTKAIVQILGQLSNRTEIVVKGRDIYCDRIFILLAKKCRHLKALTFVNTINAKQNFTEISVKWFAQSNGHNLKKLFFEGMKETKDYLI